MPSTGLGRRAGWLLALAVALVLAFFGLVASGERGGETFFSNAVLASTILGATAAAIVGGGFGVAAVWRNDHSPVVILSIFCGVFVAFFAFAEIAFPH